MNSTLPVNIFTWKKEKPCSPGATKIFVPQARIELATFQIPSFRKIIAGILSYEPALDRKFAENFGYVSSVQDAYKLIAEFETRSTTKFSCFKVDKDFGNVGVYLRLIYYCAFHKHANSILIILIRILIWFWWVEYNDDH